MDLAELLGVDTNAVMRKLIQSSLQKKDGRFAYDRCMLLMKKSYPEVWVECRQLANSPFFSDAEARYRLHLHRVFMKPVTRVISIIHPASYIVRM